MNDIGLLAIVLLAGLLVGIIGTLGVYNSVAAHQAEEEKKETEETIRRLTEERDQLQAQLNDFAESERNKRQAVEQPAGEAPARPAQAQRPPVAAAPRPDAGLANKREPIAAPREDRSSAKAKPAPDTGGFGPPREYGDK
jgi:hypothetical protein